MAFLAFCFDYLKSSKNFKHLSETEQRGTPYFYAECNVAQLRAEVDVKNMKSFYCFLLDFIREIDILANVFVQYPLGGGQSRHKDGVSSAFVLTT